jgi:hypothetical protein
MYGINYSFLDSIPRYEKMVNGLKRSFDDSAFKKLEVDIALGTSRILTFSLCCDREYAPCCLSRQGSCCEDNV